MPGAYGTSSGGQYRPPKGNTSLSPYIAKPVKSVKSEYYAKPTAMTDLPGWAKEIRAGANFMPMKVKPMSYNYMAIAEGPNRAVPYSAPTATQTTIGSAYFKPTDDVAGGIKKEHNLWQDIKNLGGNIVHKGGSLLMGALDVISRPGYMVRNLYKSNLENYYSQDGDINGWEALLGVIDTITPVGIVKDLATGHMDERLKAGWEGLSGQKKTSMKDILNFTNPEFTEKHKTATNILSVLGDIATDPITWVTMGANPGSIARLGGAGAKLAMGDKMAAARLWEETIFTKTGREAGLNVVKSDIRNREARRLARKGRGIDKQLTKAEQGKKTKLDADALRAKKVEITQSIKDKMDEDLQGAALAAKIFKKSLPTLGLTTLSRFNTGAGASTALKGEEALKVLSNNFHAGVANNLEGTDRWKAFYVANQGRDFRYTTETGHVRTVKLSEAKNLKDFIRMVSEEASPIARYAESGAKAARSRKGRNVAVSARGHTFLNQFKTHVEDSMLIALSDDATQKAFDSHRGLLNFIDSTPAATDDMKGTDKLIRVSQEDLLDDAVDTSFDALERAAKGAREASGKTNFKKDKAHIMVEGIDGKYRKVSIKAARAAAETDSIIRKARIERRVTLAQRTKEQLATDRISGVSDNVAVARANFLKAAEAVRVARETGADNYEALAKAREALGTALADVSKATKGAWESKVPEEAKKVYNSMREVLYDSGNFTTAERTKYMAILKDTSMPMEERIALILRDKDMSNSEAQELLGDAFKIHIDEDGVIHVTRGGDLSHIPEIIKAVIRDRFAQRIAGGQSGVKLEDNPLENIFRVVADGKNPDAPAYLRDVNGELGMMILDGYRAAAEYAMKNDLWSDPEILFATIHNSMSEFTNLLSADMKAQVGQFLYNTTGLRLPDEFVPKFTDIIDLLSNKKMVWRNADGKPGNQEIPWQEFGMQMQRWLIGSSSEKGLFKGIFDVRTLPGAKTGHDMVDLLNQITFKALHVDIDVPGTTPEHINAINSITESVRYLEGLVAPAPVNGVTGSVNRYSMTDFMMHAREIIAAHKKPTTLPGGKAGAGRLSALDSFTYADERTVAALEKLDQLRVLSAQKNDPILAELAQRQLSALFIKHGGIDIVKSVTMPPSGNLADLDFGKPFSTLGAHARMKEGMTNRTGFGTKRHADLMESMWGQQTLVHEWQKAFQNQILDEVFVKGRTIQQAGRRLQENIDAAFGPYENIKKRIYPTKGAINKDLALEGNVRPPVGEPDIGAKAAAPHVEALIGVRKAQEDLETARANLATAVDKVKNAGPIDDPTLLANLKKAQTEYEEAKLAESSKAAATGEEGSVATGPTEDPTDVANVGVGPLNFTDEEKEVIRKYISSSYAGASPQKVAKQLHALSMAISSDVWVAQAELNTALQDFSIKYGASVKFMGIPFMPMVNPMNATHTTAGVMRLAEETSKATRFFGTLYGPEAKTSWGVQAHKYLTKRSHVNEGTLDQLSTSVINYASMTRQRVFAELDDLYKIAVEQTEYLIPQINAMSRKDKFAYIRTQIFTPSQAGVPDALEQFKLADGSNPVREIVANMDTNATRAFVRSADAGTRKEEILKFNRYMDKEYRLDDIIDINIIETAMKPGGALSDPTLVPYTREWFQKVGQLPGSEKFSTKELLKINLGALQTALHDAKIKMYAGDKLHNGVFAQFSFKRSPTEVAMYNTKVVPQMLDVNGKQLRGRLVSVDDLQRLGIPDKNIPAAFKKGGYYIEEEFVSDIKVLFDFMDNKHNLNTNIDMQFIDKILSKFKASVTIYKVPTYPVRNLIGDTFMSAMDGLVDPRYYGDAAALMRDHHEVMKGINLDEHGEFINQSYLQREIARAAHDPAVAPDAPINPTPFNLTLKLIDGDIKINGSQIMDSYYQLGLGQNHTSGVINESVASARQTQWGKKLGKVHDGLRDLNTVREDWSRLSHFLYAIEREAPLGGTYEDVIRRAGNRVIKYHFDYNDISIFDKATLGRAIPFYKWVKNIVPFTIANLVTKPWAIKVESGLNSTLSYLIDDDKGDTRKDFVVPEWIEFDSAVPIGSYKDENGYEFGQWASMYLPMSDTLKRTLGPIFQPAVDPMVKNKPLAIGGGAITVGMSMINPLYKGAVQAATGEELWPTGGAPEKGSWFSTMASVIPGYSSIDPYIKSIEKYAGDKNAGIQGKNTLGSLLEELGAINVHNNSENAQLGELKRREDYYRPQLNQQKAELMNKIGKKYPETTADERKMIVDEFLKMTRSADPERLTAR